jgi:GDP-L-fucose synthase
MDKKASIFVAGHRGLVGSAIVRNLKAHGYSNIVVRTRGELDLTRQAAVEDFFEAERPEFVFLAAAKVGGILANSTQGADFIRDNLLVQTNVIEAAYRHGARKLQFLGSSCIYPKMAPQPMHETDLLTGPLEPTNEPYSIAKIAGIKMCQAYRAQYGFDAISVMPTNLYGPADNFDLQSSHVLPALMRKVHEAKVNGAPSVTIWGTGAPRREFLHVDDLADACVFLMTHYSDAQIVNAGLGADISIREAAELMTRVVGYSGELVFDASKPDGTPRKLLDVSKLNGLGWTARITLEDGLRSTYQWYLENVAETATAR